MPVKTLEKSYKGFAIHHHLEKIGKKPAIQGKGGDKNLTSTMAQRVFCPFVLQIKLLFQILWKLSIGWDESLTQDFQTDWDILKKQGSHLEKIKIPRRVTRDEKLERQFLAIFCDASEKAYGSAVYFVSCYENGNCSSHLCFAKARVAPIKFKGKKLSEEYSIVRLELLAMLLGARIGNYVLEGLETTLGKIEMHFFSDSMINLQRLLKGFGAYKQWVGSRLKEVTEKTALQNWYHVETQLNSADIASRGTPSVSELIQDKLWWHGPDYLRFEPKDWPNKLNKNKSTPFEDVEMKNKEEISFSISVELANEFFEKLTKRFSSWEKMISFFVCILRFGHPEFKKYRKLPRSVEEDISVENFLFQIIQKNSFQTEYFALQKNESIPKNSSLSKHYLVLENGLIRTVTRFEYSKEKKYDEKRPLSAFFDFPSAILGAAGIPNRDSFLIMMREFHSH